MKLYFSPGACSLAPHIVLEESGQPYELQRVNLAEGEQRTPGYLKIHPNGRVPALAVDGGAIITENTAILPYLGRKFGLWPKDDIGEARALSIIGLFAAGVHQAYAHVRRPGRYATDAAAHPNIQDTGRASYNAYLAQVDGMLAGREWFCDSYSVVDAYALVFYSWAKRSAAEFPVDGLANYTAFRDRMLARPAVRKVLEDEKVQA
ncbi:MAG: glutathione S-transferase N-terminal domain-containing protein [Hyphomicrobiaceae bacterium]|nr:glutathione S-transferase N-terminal domain-containing protein [Hyphomicrobiaceae bacterium]